MPVRNCWHVVISKPAAPIGPLGILKIYGPLLYMHPVYIMRFSVAITSIQKQAYLKHRNIFQKHTLLYLRLNPYLIYSARFYCGYCVLIPD